MDNPGVLCMPIAVMVGTGIMVALIWGTAALIKKLWRRYR